MAVRSQWACARLESGTSQIAAYIEEEIESARSVGWPVMGLQTSESGGTSQQ